MSKNHAKQPLLKLDDLHVSFQTHAGTIFAARGVSFQVNPGEVVALVGESGCGKSVTAQSILQLNNHCVGHQLSGSVRFHGEELVGKSDKQMRQIRGKQIGMIFQDPMTSLSPLMQIGRQLTEGVRYHQGLTKKQALKTACALLDSVGIMDPELRIKQYPHEFSGGMRQRVVIAMALAANPDLIIADEPTTALDVTIQAQILDLIKKFNQTQGSATLLITHDLGIVAGLCDRVVVMYAGKVLESGSVDQIFYNPAHPYTKALLKAVPSIKADKLKTLQPIHGAPPDLRSLPKGCPFMPRCPLAMHVCENRQPKEEWITSDHRVSCWLQHPLAEKQKARFEGGIDE